MNKNRLIIIIGIVVASVALAGNLFMKYLERNTGPEMTMSGKEWKATPTPASQEIRYYTEGEILDTMEKNLEELFSGRWDVAVWEDDDRTVVDVRIFSDTVAAARDTAAAGMGDMPEKWDRLVESTRVSSSNWRDAFEMNQHYGYMVRMGYYDDADPDTAVFLCVNGVTALDPVHGVDLMRDIVAAQREAAAAESSSSVMSYVVNTDSQVFHLPGCSSAGNISASNRASFTGDRADLIRQGYRPCQICDP